MTVSERRKGMRGQQEVQRILREVGIELHRLGGAGDISLILEDGTRLHIEVKRQERLQLKEWLRQAETEAAPGAVPVVVFRQSRGEWYGTLPLDDLLRLVG